MAETQHRKLAAIMFTDIVGYTALMSRDERLALQVLDRHRAILKPLIQGANGEWLKEIGDGTLSAFGSAVEAVQCALEIQRSLADDQDLTLRIGIHIGDVVFKDRDVFGDGVNVASRIEPLAEPGGICISDRVYDDIRNQAEMATRLVGQKNLKGVARPITVYALLVDGTSLAHQRAGEPEMGVSGPSIAVLPFVDMSPDKDQEYFCDGMAEELIDALAKVEGLRVVARTSTFVFKHNQQDIRQIGAQLNVDKVLEGSVRKAGKRLRITTQLINVADGYHLWSEKFDRDLEDIFAVQDEIALTVVQTLKVKLVPSQQRNLVGRNTQNLEAHDALMKGNHHWNQQTPDAMQTAIAYYKTAIELDSGFAMAYSSLANTYVMLALYGGAPSSQMMPLAREATQQALELDPQLAEAHISAAIISFSFDWDWETADKEFQAAIALKPGSSWGHFFYAYYLVTQGRFDEAIPRMMVAIDLDPLSPALGAYLGQGYHLMRRDEEAIRQLNSVVELEPNYWESHHYLSGVYSQLNRHEDAIASAKRAVALADNPAMRAILAYVHARAGDAKKAHEVIGQIEAAAGNMPLPTPFYAVVYIAFGDFKKALSILEEAYENRVPSMNILMVEPIFDPLRDEPRFKALLSKMGLSS